MVYCIALSNVFSSSLSFTSSTAQKVRCFRHQGSIRKEADRANRKERAHKSTAKSGPSCGSSASTCGEQPCVFSPPRTKNNLSRTAQCLQAFAPSGSHHSFDVLFLGTVSLLCCLQSHRVTKMANNDKEPVYVVGVGMTKFLRPGTTKVDYPLMAKEAVMAALSDCRVPYESVQQACVGYVYGDSTCGQRALYEVGMTGIPIFNVNNNCSTGSTALLLANQFVKGGRSDCVLAVGFEKMEKGSLTSKFRDRANPLDKHLKVLQSHHTIVPAPMAAQMFGAAGQEHMVKYGTTKEHFAKIAQKNHRHALHNPNSQGNREYTLPEILDSPLVYGPLTRLQCCPTTNGAAAAVVASKSFVEKNNLQSQAIEIVGMEMTTDPPSSLSENSCIKMVGFDMTKNAAQRLYERTLITPNDVDVVELHDCFSTNELITYEALGLCEVGKGAELVDANDNTYGGKYVINPSGGLIAKGHPLGATGLAQCSELCWQLRGSAGLRQVPGAKVALQHNIGLGGAVVVSLYKHGYPEFVKSSRNYQAKL